MSILWMSPIFCVLARRKLRITKQTTGSTTLQQLLEYYWQGLQTPLPFAPKSGWEYAQTQDIKKALTRWEGNNFVQGEQFTVENALLFAEQSPLDNEQFIHIAELLFKEALVE